MNTPVQHDPSNHFFLGLLTGGVIGAAVVVALAPRLASELRQRVAGAIADVSDAASSGYRDASSRVVGTVDEIATRGQAVRDDVADAVVRGARSVEQFAAAAKSDAKRA